MPACPNPCRRSTRAKEHPLSPLKHPSVTLGNAQQHTAICSLYRFAQGSVALTAESKIDQGIWKQPQPLLKLPLEIPFRIGFLRIGFPQPHACRPDKTDGPALGHVPSHRFADRLPPLCRDLLDRTIIANDKKRFGFRIP